MAVVNGPVDVQKLKDAIALKIWVDCKLPLCSEYMVAFGDRSEVARTAGDNELEKALLFVARVCLLPLRSDSDIAPLGPDLNADFVSIGLFDEAELAALSAVLPEIDDSELKARVADLLWLARRKSLAKFTMAMSAIRSYVAAARRLVSLARDLDASARLQRALRLALRLDGQDAVLAEVAGAIEETLESRRGTPTFPLVHVVEHLLLSRHGEAATYSAYCEEMASNAETGSHWELARKFWQLASHWHQREQQLSAANEAARRAAETYASEANDALRRTDTPFSVAGYFLGQAIHALRQLPGLKPRCDELHRRMLDYQTKAAQELISFGSEPIDCGDQIEAARARVRGKGLEEAVRVVALSVPFSSVQKLREWAQEAGGKYLGLQLLPRTFVSSTGKTLDRRPASGSNANSEIEEFTLSQMFLDANLLREMRIKATINPMRDIIWQEHNPQLRDVLPLTVNNPFVPPGREYLFARGLLAGLIGEFEVAAHLLVPQIENSLRYVLAQRGIITSGFDDDGIQNEYDLNKLLTIHRRHVEAIWGDDVAFELRGLLVERPGQNFRNSVSHGLLDSISFFSPAAVYVWWLVLHLCASAWLTLRQTSEAPAEPPPPGN